jgi:hypothetical protein
LDFPLDFRTHAAMFLYPPITRLQDAADAHARLNDAFKDVFVTMCRVAKERPQSWKRNQRKEFAKLARKLHEVDNQQVTEGR